MSTLAFLRAANVGGHQRFRPKLLEQALPELRLRNFGAAGTFLVAAELPEDAIRAAFAAALPFEPQLALVPAAPFAALVARDPLAAEAEALGAKRYLSVLLEPAPALPPLPLGRPEGPDWQVQLAEVGAWYALSLRRGEGAGVVYPNFLDKTLGVPLTTRGWPTVQRLAKALGQGVAPLTRR
jgi:uncharacterized protein (DUF1697 family)